MVICTWRRYILTKLRDNERAIRLLKDARRHFPGASQITYLLAIALREAKQYQASVALFEEALHESQAQGDDVANGRFFFEYGAAAERAGLYDKAAELFKKSVQLDPADAAEAYNYLGFMWADQNTHLDEAEDYIKRALAADPENGAYLDSLGWLHFRRGQYEQALAELLSAKQALKTDDPTVLEHIGDTYSMLNQLPKALEYWQKALALDQTNNKLAAKIEAAKTKAGPGTPAGCVSEQMTKYPTLWQRKTMWASLTAIFVVLLVIVVGSAIWAGVTLIAFLQPILIPVAIAVIIAYLLDPVVTYLTRHGLSRTRAVLALFTIAFLAVAALVAWIVPLVSVQSVSLARQLPAFTERTRDRVVDLIYRYEHTFGVPSKEGKTGAATGFVNWLLAGSTPAAPCCDALPGSQALRPPRRTAEVIGPRAASPKLTSADRQRIQDWVQKQLPVLERQLPDLTAKLWLLIKTSVGGFLGVTGFLLSLVMVPIYSFFLLKERPAIQRRWKEYLPLRNSPLKDEVATTLSQINSYVIAYFRGQLLVCLVDGLLIGSCLTALGLNFAPLIGLLVVPLTMIPLSRDCYLLDPRGSDCGRAVGRLVVSLLGHHNLYRRAKCWRVSSTRRASSVTPSVSIR